jgi:hypothetical protein
MRRLDVVERVVVEHHVECAGKNISVLSRTTTNKAIYFTSRFETTKFKLKIKTKVLLKLFEAKWGCRVPVFNLLTSVVSSTLSLKALQTPKT